MSLFETLYDLGVKLLTAAPDSDLGRLTAHHCRSGDEAETVIRDAVLQRTMPGEDTNTRWGILRVFMRNLVNRAQSPMPANVMLSLLDEISLQVQDESPRSAALVNAVADNARLRCSLGAVLEPGHAPDGCSDYIDWLKKRINEYRHMPVTDIDPVRVLSQLHHMAHARKTKIPNIGTALASNLFADLGIRVVGKPDLHVLPTVAGLLGTRSLKPEACIGEIIRIAQNEAALVRARARFSWIDGGLYPRDVDRMIYLIGSDNFRLNGIQRKVCAPRRRRLMLEAIC
jgi:hypothetical protein